MTQHARRPLVLNAALALALFAGTVQGRQEAAPTAQPGAADALNRRVLDGPPTVLAFKNVTVEQLVAFIVEATGKVVMPQQDVMTRKVTVVNDRPIPRQQALDLVFLALQQAGVAVVENKDLITLRDIGEIQKIALPVIGPRESVLERTDVGAIYEKVFGLRHASAENLGEILKDSVPDYAKLSVDKESNQVVVIGPVALLKRIESLITSLDQPAAASLATETFRLRYADAEIVATNVRDLFSADARTGGNNQNRGGGNNNLPAFFQRMGEQQGGNRGGNQNQGRGNTDNTQTSANLRVTANTQQNSVTVLAERDVIEQVRTLIADFWDKPLPDEAVVPRIYDLKNSDPIKVRDLLEGLFGRGTPTAGTTGGGGGNQGGGNRSSGTTEGVGRLAGQFSFQAIPESGRLVVVSKSPDNLTVIDKIIEGIDQPQSVGLPEVVELKHAQSEELAEQLNTLLAQDGTLAQLRRSDSGLSTSSSSTSPFASQQNTQDTQNAQNTQNQSTSADQIAFWWQRSRPPTDKRGASNLIGSIRIVPVWRQNAVMVLAPPEYRNSVAEMIRQLDKPGRQVLISAIICELNREDATSLGIRWSSQAINPTLPDNSLSISSSSQISPFLADLFNSSILNVNTNINVLLQALNEKTAVNILSEPRIFTSDNQEAEFFDGQDIPFVTDSQTNQNGNLVQSFDYRAVGIVLRARPRITVNRDIDLRVNVQLSSIAPGGTTALGGFIVDRRETTTQLILRDGQTAVISGILRQELNDITRKVPLLGDIPLLGLIFRSTEKQVVDKELLVFITPIVISNDEEHQRVNKPFLDRRDRLKQNLNEAVRKDIADDSDEKQQAGEEHVPSNAPPSATSSSPAPKPAPTEPAPTEPAPTEPAPTEPAPSEPQQPSERPDRR